MVLNMLRYSIYNCGKAFPLDQNGVPLYDPQPLILDATKDSLSWNRVSFILSYQIDQMLIINGNNNSY